MATRQRTKAQADLAASAARMPVGTITPGAVLSPAAFAIQLQALIKDMEKATPLKNARELENRINEGQRKIQAVKASDKAHELADKIADAEGKLAGLRAELHGLRVKWLIPHLVMHMTHYLLDTNERHKWPLAGNGTITIKLPGIIDIAVEVPSGEIPF